MLLFPVALSPEESERARHIQHYIFTFKECSMLRGYTTLQARANMVTPWSV